MYVSMYDRERGGDICFLNFLVSYDGGGLVPLLLFVDTQFPSTGIDNQ